MQSTRGEVCDRSRGKARQPGWLRAGTTTETGLREVYRRESAWCERGEASVRSRGPDPGRRSRRARRTHALLPRPSFVSPAPPDGHPPLFLSAPGPTRTTIPQPTMSPAPAVPVSSVGIAPPPGSLPPTAAGVVAGSGSHPAAGSSAAAPPLTTTSAPSHRPARRRSRSVSTSSSLGSHLASDDDDDDEGDELSDDDSSTDGRVEAALDRLPPPPPVPSQGGPFAKKAKHDSPPGGQHLQQQHQHQMQHQLQLQQQQQGGNQPARKQNVVRPSAGFSPRAAPAPFLVDAVVCGTPRRRL